MSKTVSSYEKRSLRNRRGVIPPVIIIVTSPPPYPHAICFSSHLHLMMTWLISTITGSDCRQNLGGGRGVVKGTYVPALFYTVCYIVYVCAS